MASKSATPAARQSGDVRPLQTGERLDQPTFHARYQGTSEDVKAELIGGVVYVQASLKRRHGRYHSLLMMWLGNYWTATPGTDVCDNTTTILGDDSEPQPDAALLVLGGQTHEDAEGWLVGPPEFLGEVSDTTERLDLHAKREDYERWGVQEYLVVLVRQQRVVWFTRGDQGFEELAPGEDGILRSQFFPGLWLDPEAFFRVDLPRVQEVLNRGLATPEHAAFVARLQARSGE